MTEGKAEVGDDGETAAGAQLRLPEPLASIAGFALQSVVGALSFLAIYVAALTLGAAIRALNATFGADPWLAETGALVERVLVYVDIAIFLLFLAMEIAKYARKLIQEWRRP